MKIASINLTCEVKTFEDNKLVVFIKPETKWSNNEQVENEINFSGRTELVTVAKVWDDLLLGVKGQTNLEIAGFLRKVFRCYVLLLKLVG